jgi:hypothetical protein
MMSTRSEHSPRSQIASLRGVVNVPDLSGFEK